MHAGSTERNNKQDTHTDKPEKREPTPPTTKQNKPNPTQPKTTTTQNTHTHTHKTTNERPNKQTQTTKQTHKNKTQRHRTRQGHEADKTKTTHREEGGGTGESKHKEQRRCNMMQGPTLIITAEGQCHTHLVPKDAPDTCLRCSYSRGWTPKHE